MAMLNNQRVVGFNGIYDNRFVGRLSKGFSSRSWLLKVMQCKDLGGTIVLILPVEPAELNSWTSASRSVKLLCACGNIHIQYVFIYIYILIYEWDYHHEQGNPIDQLE